MRTRRSDGFPDPALCSPISEPQAVSGLGAQCHGAAMAADANTASLNMTCLLYTSPSPRD
eukprot:4185630-Alexandrium_andersonii.AAC.1